MLQWAPIPHPKTLPLSSDPSLRNSIIRLLYLIVTLNRTTTMYGSSIGARIGASMKKCRPDGCGDSSNRAVLINQLIEWADRRTRTATCAKDLARDKQGGRENVVGASLSSPPIFWVGANQKRTEEMCRGVNREDTNSLSDSTQRLPRTGHT